MPLNFRLPGQPKKNKPMPHSGPTAMPRVDNDKEVEKAPQPDQSIRFDNMEQVETAFKQGKIDWPRYIIVGDLKYDFLKSSQRGLQDILTGKKQGYIIYHLPHEHVKKAKERNMGQWMIFLFRKESGSQILPYGVGFTTKARGKAIYEDNQVVGDVVLIKIALPSAVIALKGKVDTGAEISSLHVDSKPRVIGNTVRFENHNASGSIITAPLVTQQAVKSADGGTEYRPIIELDIEVQGKPISKAQFNLNDRSKMEHEVLIGQNILEKAGFIVNPSLDGMKQESEEDEENIGALNEDELDDLMDRIVELMEASEEE